MTIHSLAFNPWRFGLARGRVVLPYPFRFNYDKQKVNIMKLSARNILKGTVKEITHGAVDSEVVIELTPGVEIVSIITKSSAEGLGLTVGGTAYAIIKAPNVIVAVDD